MRVWLLFLTICFLLGGTRLGATIARRPVLLLALSIVFSLSFYSYRVVR